MLSHHSQFLHTLPDIFTFRDVENHANSIPSDPMNMTLAFPLLIILPHSALNQIQKGVASDMLYAPQTLLT